MKIDLDDINKYIKKVYQIDTTITLNFKNLKQICFKNKKLYNPYCSFYIDICPDWGFAPNQLLLHYSTEKKDHTGSSGAIIYKGLESIDWVMQNGFELEKKEQQLTLF